MALAAVGVIALWREFLTATGLAAQLGVDLAAGSCAGGTLSEPKRGKRFKASAKPSTASSTGGS